MCVSAEPRPGIFVLVFVPTFPPAVLLPATVADDNEEGPDGALAIVVAPEEGKRVEEGPGAGVGVGADTGTVAGLRDGLGVGTGANRMVVRIITTLIRDEGFLWKSE